jgi:hypothetical protein
VNRKCKKKKLTDSISSKGHCRRKVTLPLFYHLFISNGHQYRAQIHAPQTPDISRRVWIMRGSVVHKIICTYFAQSSIYIRSLSIGLFLFLLASVNDAKTMLLCDAFFYCGNIEEISTWKYSRNIWEIKDWTKGCSRSFKFSMSKDSAKLHIGNIGQYSFV